MGRGKWDNCENCKFATKQRDGMYSCKFDRKEDHEKDYWCKYHEGEDEE